MPSLPKVMDEMWSPAHLLQSACDVLDREAVSCGVDGSYRGVVTHAGPRCEANKVVVDVGGEVLVPCWMRVVTFADNTAAYPSISTFRWSADISRSHRVGVSNQAIDLRPSQAIQPLREGLSNHHGDRTDIHLFARPVKQIETNHTPKPNPPPPQADVVSPWRPESTTGLPSVRLYEANTVELDDHEPPQTSPIITAGPSVPSRSPPYSSASESTAHSPHQPLLSNTNTSIGVEEEHADPSERPRKRRRRSSSPSSHRTVSHQKPKRQRPDSATDTSMRLDLHNQDHRPRPSTNGSSSQNASSPHTNGSAKSNTETNGHRGVTSNGHAVVQPDTTPFFGHDREEVTRILLQSLSDLGYHGAARQLSSDSGYELEIPSVAAFRAAVLDGEWEEAEGLLFGSGGGEFEGGVSLENGRGNGSAWDKHRLSFGSQNGYARHGLPLAEGADITLLKFLIRQQKYLELLEHRDRNAALSVLRNELTPLKRDVQRLHQLSSLMMAPSREELLQQAGWDGESGDSRSLLLSAISTQISPSVMIPEHRLATLLTDVQQDQILSCRYHNTTEQPSLYTDHECSQDDFPLQLLTELKNHGDEVWHLEFSHDGSMLATAGKDGLVCIYDTQSWRIRHEIREHDRNLAHGDLPRGVCYIAFSPDDQHLISCSQNNEFVVINVRDGKRVASADHFDYPVTTAAWLPDNHTFVVGTQGSRRPLGLYSLRGPGPGSSAILRNNEIHSWRDPPWDHALDDNPISFRITDCAVSPDGARMVATTLDNRIMLFDLRTRIKLADWAMEDKLTSINFGVGGSRLLVNMNEGKVLALDAGTGEVTMRYEGAEQAKFVIRSCFGGAGENFVMSGSEDSRVYIWRRQTGVQVAVLDAHSPGTVNAVAWHPTECEVFASAGDDRRVRIWTSDAALRRQAMEAGDSRTSLGSYLSAR